jgi:Right handed beta helix region
MKSLRPCCFLLGIFLLSVFPGSAEAQLGHWQGWCEVGGHTDSASGSFVQASYPSCTVDVYFFGTTTHAAIYSDLKSTALSNPFNAGANASFEFYAPQEIPYDVVISEAGITVPFKYSHVLTAATGGIVSSPPGPQTITGHKLVMSDSAPLVVESAALLNATSTQTLNNIQFADRFPGADACARIHAATMALPAAGGTVDARGFQGAQSCKTDPFSSTTRPVHLLLGAAEFRLATRWTLPVGSTITCLSPRETTIAGTSGSPTLNVQSETTVENCHVVGGNKAINSGDNGAAVTRVTIKNNVIEGSLLGPNVNLGGQPSYWLVEGNVIRRGMNEGVLVNANRGAIVDDPRCTVADNCGYNQIINNWIYGNLKNGIDVNSSRNSIMGNHVFMNGGTGQADTGRDQFGILLFAAQGETPVSHNLVSHNEVFSNNTFGIAIVAAPSGTVSYNIVNENSVRYNGTTASSGAADGIFLEGYQTGNVLNNLVSNNEVVGNSRNGIFLNFPVPGTGLMTQNQIVDNQLLGNAQYGFASDGGCCGGGVFENYVVNNLASGNLVGQIADFGSTAGIYSNKASNDKLLDVATSVFGNKIPTSMFAVTMSGLSNDTAGFKHKRFGQSCTTPSTVGQSCTTTYTWTTPFLNNSYTVTCSLGGTITGKPTIVGITSKLGEGITVSIANLTPAMASASEVDCIAVHD